MKGVVKTYRILMTLAVMLSVMTGFSAECTKSPIGGGFVDAFLDPPREAGLRTWWHWGGNRVTREGITADLKAMSEVGITRACIFTPPGDNPVPEVKMLSDDWFGMFDHALREAKRFGIELAAHNCPGQSSSGGPWIRPEDSMKILVSSEMEIRGGERFCGKLPQPDSRCGLYGDVAVVAFPVPDDPVPASGGGPLVLETPKVGDEAIVSVSYECPFPARTLLIDFDEDHLAYRGNVEASDDGRSWKSVAKIDFVLFRTPRTPKIVPLADVPETTRHYRVCLKSVESPSWIPGGVKRLRSVVFSSECRIVDVEKFNATGFDYAFAGTSGGGDGIREGDVFDLTDRLKPDALFEWAAPKGTGRWRILRIGYTSTGALNQATTFRGLECDKLSRRGLDAHWPHMPAKLLARPLAKEVFKELLIDSYEVGGQNWTEGFDKEFSRRRGYDLTRMLPVVFGYEIGGRASAARFLNDLQKTVSELFLENYYGYFAELCHANGVSCAIEAYIGAFDWFGGMTKADVPMAEFWTSGDVGQFPRLAASAAHVTGKRLVAAEAFTTLQNAQAWQITPRALRECGDVAWSEGVNSFVLHTYAHQPMTDRLPGMSMCGHGSHFNRNLTWWPEAKVWTDYVRRGQALLQCGSPRHDVLIVTPAREPNPAKRERRLTDRGYEYDWISEEFLTTDIARRYRLVHRAEDGDVTAAVARKALRPSAKPSDGSPLAALVREKGDERLFFVRNPGNRAISAPIVFDAELRSFASRLYAENGSIEPLAVKRVDGDATIDLWLNPHESAFVLFGNRPFAAHGAVPPHGDGVGILELSSDWKLGRFDGLSAPKDEFDLERITFWTSLSDEKVRHFSGRAVYSRRFNCPSMPAGRLFLDLGVVREVARVKLNGRSLGVTAFPPLSCGSDRVCANRRERVGG